MILDGISAAYGIDLFVVGLITVVALLILITFIGGDRHVYYLNVVGIPVFIFMIAYGYQYTDNIILITGIVGLLQTSVKVFVN